jgi:Iron-containing redox enzyme
LDAAIRTPVILEDTIVRADQIYGRCLRHSAITALRSFNRHFSSRPLTRPELVLFLASMAAFNRHTVGGIAILAGRLSDEVLGYLPRTGHDIAAYILDAAIDEYGLRETPNHVELARNFAEHLGISADEVETRENACAAALDLGEALFSWYREEPVAFAVGAHVASEVTSVNEFISWHDVFLVFPQYRFSLDLPEFEYMRTHCAHEPDHSHKARMCISRYLDVLPGNGNLLREGAQTYLDLYQKMFHDLDTLIFK